MAEHFQFTRNYNDLSTNKGFQFEFCCDRCGTGYRTKFKSSASGMLIEALDTAGSIFGGLFGQAADVSERVRSAGWQQARDEAFVEAINELQPDFIQLLAIAEEFELRLDGDWYLLPVPTSQPVMFLHAPGLNHPPLADSSRFPADSLIQLLGMDQRAPTVRALGFRIRSLCNIQGCQSF